ncbi:acyltransferase [Candidatus Woesebacteria bacterium]|nr:acyltransferase [Candidatus Woesebacteria bacterium]
MSILYTKISRRLHTIWLEFVTGILWWGVGYIPSHHIRRLFYRLSGIKIGQGSTIHMMARIYDPRFIRIGIDTIIGEKSTLDGRRQLPNSKGGLTIGNHVDIASEVMLWTSQHDINDVRFRAIEEPVTIEDYVFIGPRAIILPGVTVGTGAIVAAGAVVTKNVKPLSVVAGVPAKEIALRTNTNPTYQLGRARWFQ